MRAKIMLWAFIAFIYYLLMFVAVPSMISAKFTPLNVAGFAIAFFSHVFIGAEIYRYLTRKKDPK